MQPEVSTPAELLSAFCISSKGTASPQQNILTRVTSIQYVEKPGKEVLPLLFTALLPQPCANQPYSTLAGGITHINVGQAEIPFDVHLELLCDCSPYFDTLYNNRTVDKNTTKKPISFPDDDPAVFAELVSWMYRGELSPNLPSIFFLFQLWVLAAELRIQDLQDLTFSHCKQKVTPGAVFGNETVNYVYNNTLPGSPLRHLVVDIWAQNGTRERFSCHREKLPRAFLEDFCAAMIERDGLPEQYATSAQMGHRDVKTPSSRLRSSASPSPRVMTPVSVASNVDSKGDITLGMNQLGLNT